MYNTSKDYKKLYDLVMSDKEIICLVDYGKHSRDICRTRLDDYSIEFSARGIGYLTIFRRETDDKKYDEETILKHFIGQCKLVDVEWVIPHNEK